MKEIVKDIPVIETPATDIAGLSKIIIVSVIMAITNALCSAQIFCLPEDFTVRLTDVVYHFSPAALLNIVGFVLVIVFRKWFLQTTNMPSWLQKIIQPIFNLIQPKAKI